MSRAIADGEVLVNFAPTIVDTSAPTTVELTAGTDVTPWLSTIDTPLDGDAVDSSDLSSAFNKTVAGTYGGNISGEMYRDDTADTAWDLFDRDTEGYFVIRRFGGSDVAWTAADVAEVYQVRIITKSPGSLDRNNVQMFGIDAAVLDEPVLDAVIFRRSLGRHVSGLRTAATPQYSRACQGRGRRADHRPA